MDQLLISVGFDCWVVGFDSSDYGSNGESVDDFSGFD